MLTYKCLRCGKEEPESNIRLVRREGLILCKCCFEEYEKEKASRPKKGRVCVIDDAWFMKGFSKEILEDYDVSYEPRIPLDEEILAGFDVLIVDGEGIGNSKYKNGVEFLKAYKKQGQNKGLIHFSGFISPSDEKALEALGVECLEKGGDPDLLVQAVEEVVK